MVQNWPILGNTGKAVPAHLLEGEMDSAKESSNLGGNGRPLESLKTEQHQPMRMLLSGHEFSRAFTDSHGEFASNEASVFQEGAKQIQITLTQLTAKEM
jgi:hypothetical protein